MKNWDLVDGPFGVDFMIGKESYPPVIYRLQISTVQLLVSGVNP